MRPVQALAAEREPALRKAMSAVGASLSAMRTFLARPMRNQVKPRATSSGLRREAAGGSGGVQGGQRGWLRLRADAAELRHHLLVVEDGAGDEVGEEGDEEEVGEEVLALRLALGEVDQVGDLGEGEEGDAQGKRTGWGLKLARWSALTVSRSL